MRKNSVPSTFFHSINRRDLSLKNLRYRSENKFPNKTRQSLPSLPRPGNVVSKCAYKSKKGKPKAVNQDSYLIHPYVGGIKNQYIFGVFDGHGDYGGQVSQFLKEKTGALVEENLSFNVQESLKSALREVCMQLENSEIDTSFSGSTLNLIFIRSKEIVCANIGDSRAVIGQKSMDKWRSIDVSNDHKPDLPGEEWRIIRNRGRVRPYYNSQGVALGPARVWLHNEDTPGLAMSRSIGDQVAHRVGVIDEAEFRSFKLSSHDSFIIIATDGLWEVIDSDEAVFLIGSDIDAGRSDTSCHRLVKEARRRWRKGSDTIDDITVLIVFLKH